MAPVFENVLACFYFHFYHSRNKNWPLGRPNQTTGDNNPFLPNHGYQLVFSFFGKVT